MSRLSKVLLGVAVVLLVGGGSATAAKLVTGKTVKNESLTGADLKNRSVGAADLSTAVRRTMRGTPGPAGPAGPAGPQGPKGDTGPQGPTGTPDGYTTAEADGRFLAAGGKAVNAQKAGGVDGDDLVIGDGEIAFNSMTRAYGTPATKLLDVGDYADVEFECGDGGLKTVDVRNTGAAGALTVQRSLDAAGEVADASWKHVQPAAVAEAASTTVSAYRLTLTIMRRTAPGVTSRFATVLLNSSHSGGVCRTQAHVLGAES